VIGFPIIGAFTPSLAHASYEAAGYRQPVPAVVVNAEQALRGDHDAELVKLEGQLIGQDDSASDPTIVLASGHYVFSVTLPAQSAAQGLPPLEKRNHLQNSGHLLGKGWNRPSRHGWGGLFHPDVVSHPAALAAGCDGYQESFLVDAGTRNRHVGCGGDVHSAGPHLGVCAPQASAGTNQVSAGTN